MKSLLLLWLICGFPTLTFICLCNAFAADVFYIGQNKGAWKKYNMNYKLWQRMLLFHVREHKHKCKKPKTLRFLLICGDIYSVILVALMVGCVPAVIFERESVVLLALKVKALLCDGPMFVYILCMTKPDKKRGGRTWRWTD